MPDTNFAITNGVDYVSIAKTELVTYINARLEKTDYFVDNPTEVFQIDESVVYVVWFVKVLQNWKALLSTSLPDGMYYELTFDGDKQKLFIDAYKKFDNVAVDITAH
jgi:hypothetical protein